MPVSVAGPGNEILAVYAWLYQSLSALSAVITHCQAQSESAPRLRAEQPLQGWAFPQVIYGAVPGATDDRQGVGPYRIWVDGLYWIETRMQSKNYDAGEAVNAAVDEFLQTAAVELTILSPTIPISNYRIRGVQRTRSYVSHDLHQSNDGMEFRKVGGVYRIICQKA